jgi:predicted nucleic acid-binding protein
MNMTFADTLYYLALLNPDDAAHERALSITGQRHGALVTTRWVLTEVGDAMAAPPYRPRFLRLVQAIESDPDTIIVPTTDELFHQGVTLYGQRLDKMWPLTDCISFLVMEQYGIREALTGDHHFSQAGFSVLLADAKQV